MLNNLYNLYSPSFSEPAAETRTVSEPPTMFISGEATVEDVKECALSVTGIPSLYPVMLHFALALTNTCILLLKYIFGLSLLGKGNHFPADSPSPSLPFLTEIT